MKQFLLTTIVALLLVGCGNPQPPEISIHEAVSNANIEDTKQHLAVGTDVIVQKEPLEYEAEGSLTLRLPPFSDHGSAFLRWNLPCPSSVL